MKYKLEVYVVLLAERHNNHRGSETGRHIQVVRNEQPAVFGTPEAADSYRDEMQARYPKEGYSVQTAVVEVELPEGAVITERFPGGVDKAG